MPKPEWFRRDTWSTKDREEFNIRLHRSRTSFHKAQYLRIQAGCLAEAGHHAAAIELLDRLLSEYLDQTTQLAVAHFLKARSLQALEQIDAAISELQNSLNAERRFPHSRTNAWLDYGWLILQQQKTGLYSEVTKVLNEFGEERADNLLFPVTRYRYFALRALLAAHEGQEALAKTFARKALAEAARTHSGLRYHAQLGLVGQNDASFETQLQALASD